MWTTRHELAKLRALIVKAKEQGDLRTWRRGKAMRDYIDSNPAVPSALQRDPVASKSLRGLQSADDKRGSERLSHVSGRISDGVE